MGKRALAEMEDGLPVGWIEVRIGDALEHFADGVKLLSDVEYDLISIRRRHGGMFHRNRLPGRAILTKNVQRVVSGSFVIARRQIVHGACAIAAPEFDGSIMSMSYSAFRGSPICEARYFFALAQQPHMVRLFWHSSHGVVVEKLNFQQDEWLEYPVRLPPLEEQRRIADILDTIDETIRATERVVAKIRQMHDGLRRSRFTELLETSDHRQVGACFEMILGKMLSPAAKTGTRPAQYLANRNVQWGRCRVDDLDEMDFSESERNKFSLNPGDVLVCEGGEVGRTAIWHGEVAECYFQKAVHRLRTRGDVVPEYMLHFMRHAAELDLFRSHTSQTSIAHLTGEQLARVSIPVPPMEVQRELIGALANVADRVDAEDSELAKLRAIRTGLAADLLSGRVRTGAA